MARSTNSVVLRAKARLAALRAWRTRLADASLQKLLSINQFVRANNWSMDEAAKAARLVCAFSSKAALVAELQNYFDPGLSARVEAQGLKRADLAGQVVYALVL